jgi:hypothetical protein
MSIKINFNFSPSDFNSVEEAVAYISRIQALNVTVKPNSDDSNSQPTVNERVYGPAAQEWMKQKGTTHIRCTNNRSPEEQAIHNLKTYLGYSENAINDLLGIERVDDTTVTPNLDADNFEVVYDSTSEEDCDPETLV